MKFMNLIIFRSFFAVELQVMQFSQSYSKLRPLVSKRYESYSQLSEHRSGLEKPDLEAFEQHDVRLWL
jgi:hypothetical protein